MRKIFALLAVLALALSAFAGISTSQSFSIGNLEEKTVTNDNTQYATAARTDQTDGCLKQGRTWWYNSHIRGYDYNEEYALSIGGETEINGKKWHEIWYLQMKSYDCRDGKLMESDDIPRLLCYMREDNGLVYTMYPESAYSIEFHFPVKGIREFVFFPTLGDDDYVYKEYVVYDFNAPVGSEYTSGGNGILTKFIYKKTAIEDIVNSGRNYKLHKSKLLSERGNPTLECIDGIGEVSWGFFFDPYGSGYTSITGADNPQLRYVTDENREIIYEGIGGFKLWEADGVADVTVEASAPVRWYNLQGIEMPEPTAAGIYIRRQGDESRKVYVK